MADKILEEIAAEAGVSVRTVYRILNGGEISKSRPNISRRAELIRDIAQRLHYRPNAAARAVSTGKFNCISLLLSEYPRYGYMHHDLIRGLLYTLSKKQMHLAMSVMSDTSLTSGETMPSLLNQLMADGMLINYTHGIPQKMLDLIAANNIPSVWINADLPENAVVPDDAGGGQLATAYALEKGYKNIEFLHFMEDHFAGHPWDIHFSLHERLRGYRQEMQKAGRQGIYTELTGKRMADTLSQVREWLKRPNRPDAVITTVPGVALALLSAAKELGLRLPDDLLILTFQGNMPHDELDDEIMTMVIPWFALGATAAEKIIQVIDDPGAKFGRELVPYCAPATARERNMRFAATAGKGQEFSLLSEVELRGNLF
ncbi:MAG: LacI family DNA-binding transcriptional regulator [Planctomycetes bacterium]|nr:LacI family DNA-binding transcriptional regulator [Planctomycetota bacterium]